MTLGLMMMRYARLCKVARISWGQERCDHLLDLEELSCDETDIRWLPDRVFKKGSPWAGAHIIPFNLLFTVWKKFFTYPPLPPNLSDHYVPTCFLSTSCPLQHCIF